jgi:peptidoglycan/LPS O-acetylase OafA/YrhL
MWCGLPSLTLVVLAISAAAIASLARYPSNRLDERLGDLAYPVFLLHFSAGAVAVAAFGNEGLAVGLTTAALSMLVGSMIVIGVERSLRTLRARLCAPKLRRPASVRC